MTEPIDPSNPINPSSGSNIPPETEQNIRDILKNLPPEILTKIQEALKSGNPDQIMEVLSEIKDYLSTLKGAVSGSAIESGQLQAQIENSPFMRQARDITNDGLGLNLQQALLNDKISNSQLQELVSSIDPNSKNDLLEKATLLVDELMQSSPKGDLGFDQNPNA